MPPLADDEERALLGVAREPTQRRGKRQEAGLPLKQVIIVSNYVTVLGLLGLEEWWLVYCDAGHFR